MKKPDTEAEAQAAEPMARATSLLAAGERGRALALTRHHWLKNPDDAEPAKLLAELMKTEGHQELSEHLLRLAESGSAKSKDVQNLFEAGYKFIDAREPHLAAMLLERASELRPDEAVIAYELGFALMSVRRFADAIAYLEKASGETADFDTWLNLSVCYTLTRNLSKAKDMLGTMSEMAASDEEHAELAHRKSVLKRLEKFSSKSALTSRDWLYILYGSMLLNKGEPTGKAGLILDAPGLRLAPQDSVPDSSFFGDATPGRASGTIDYKEIATTLLVLKQVFDALGIDIEVVEYYSLLSRPLAEALGRLMDIPVDSYKGPDRQDRALLMMAWASNIIGPHKSFASTSPRRHLFAYGLTASAPLPLTPEIIAKIADYCRMPWSSTSEENADEFADDASQVDLPDEKLILVVEKILQEARALESQPDIIQRAAEIAGYYQGKRELLMLGNAAAFAQRCQYTAEIPF